MLLAKAKFGYGKVFTPEEQEQIRAAVLIDNEMIKFSDSGEFETWYNHWVVDIHALPFKAIDSHFDAIKIANPMLTAALQSITENRQTVVNQRVNVAVPGFGLMAIREVEVRTDLCTEELQRELNRGWQILAICPQPDQRRPDYVLGRPQTSDNGD